MMSFGVNAQNLNEWFTDGAFAESIRMTDEVGGAVLSSPVAEIAISEDAANGDPWTAQFCAVFSENAGQVEGNEFSLSFEVYWEAASSADTATLAFLTGKNYYDEYGFWLHEDYQWSSENTELIDVPGSTYYNVSMPLKIGRDSWQTLSVTGTIGEYGSEYIGIQINMGGDENNVGTFYFRNINVRMGSGTDRMYFESGAANLELVEVENIQYAVTAGNQAKVMKFTDTEATSVVVPATVTINGNSYSVTSISNNAFNGLSKLESITIPSSVTKIGSTFGDLKNLTSVKIESDVDVSESSLYFTKDSTLYHVISKNSVEVVECTRKGDVAIAESVTAGNTFAVTGIGDRAFYNCDELKSVTIPNSVTTIGDNAFAYCDNLESLTIGNSVTRIGESAFYYCEKLTSVTIPNSVTVIGEAAFYNCSKLESVSIPNSVTEIEGWAFEYCRSLKSVSIPGSVTSIGNSAFYGCSGLEKAEFASIESMCAIEFDREYSNPLYCAHHLYIGGKEVTELVIPDGVETIGSYTFYNCTNLTSVSIPGSVTNIYYSAFGNCSGLTSVKIDTDADVSGASLSFTKDSALYGVLTRNTVSLKSAIKSGKIPSSVTAGNTFTITAIGSEAFYDCSELESVTIPETVTSIGSYAFDYCENLKSVTIPNSVKYIEYAAFRNCGKLESVVLPSKLSSVNSQLFSGCTSLKSIVIPNSVSSIDSYAFSGCTNLATVVLGNSVSSLGGSSFANCDSLVSITIYRTDPPEDDWYSSVFGSLDDEGFSKITLHVPQGSKKNYTESTPWSKMNIVEFAAYTVTINAEGGNCEKFGAGVYEAVANAQAVVSVTPNRGYQFVKWSDGITDNPRTVSLTKDTVLTAVLTEKYCNVTLLVDNERHGYVSGSTKVREGNYQSFYAYGVGTYVFDHWSTGSTNYRLSIYITQDTTLKAFFRKESLCQVVLSSNDYVMGTVDRNFSILAGSTEWIYASPNAGYRFVKWSDDNTQRSRELTVRCDTNLVAYFEPLPKYSVRIVVADSCKNMGKVTYNGPSVVCEGTDISISAEPAEGYAFKGWYYVDGALYKQNVETNYIVDDDVVLYASFEKDNSNAQYVCVPYSGIKKISMNDGESIDIYDSEGPDGTYRNSNNGDLQISLPEGCGLQIKGTYSTESGCDYLRFYEGASTQGQYIDRWEGSGTSSVFVPGPVATINFRSDGSIVRDGFQLKATAVKLVDIKDVPYTVSIAVNDTALGEAIVNCIIKTDSSYLFDVWALSKRAGYFDHWSDNRTSGSYTLEVVSDTSLRAFFKPLEAYTVTLQSCDTAMGYISGDQSGTYYDGERVVATAYAKSAEFSFVKWSDGYKYSSRTIYLTQDTTLLAEFKRNKAYTVKFISNDTTLGTVDGTRTYYDGEVAYPNVLAKTNAFFAGWSNGTYSWGGFTITSDTTIIANFEKFPYKFDVQSSDTACGEAHYSNLERVNSVIYKASIYAYEKDGNVFKNWSNGQLSSSSSVYIVSDTVFVANFEPIKYKINYVEDGNGNIYVGRTQKSGNVVEVNCKASSHEGYSFVSWSDGVDDLTDRTYAVSSDTTIGARFVKFPYKVDVVCDNTKGTATYSTVGSSLKSPIVYFYAEENPGYVFTHWSDGATSKNYSIVLDGDIELEAEFEELFVKVFVTSSDTSMGKVNYNISSWDGKQTKIEFWVSQTKRNYHFVGWSDGVKVSSRYQTFYSDTTITAIFAPNVYKISVAANDVSMGKVTAVDSATYNTDIKLNATAASGYKFVKWSDGNTDNPRTVKVTGDMQFTAVFEVAGNTNPGTAVNDADVTATNIYAYGNTIVVENAADMIRVFDAMGRLVATDNNANTKIIVNGTGVYVVKVGDLVKRVMLNN